MAYFMGVIGNYLFRIRIRPLNLLRKKMTNLKYSRYYTIHNRAGTRPSFLKKFARTVGKDYGVLTGKIQSLNRIQTIALDPTRPEVPYPDSQQSFRTVVCVWYSTLVSESCLAVFFLVQ